MNYVYRADVTKDRPAQPATKEVVLFGKSYTVYDDAWRNHLHVIPTFKCNATCSFCIEKDSKCEEKNLLSPLATVIAELQREGILHTVSFTGGEPALCNSLGQLVNMVPERVFTTVNTNGAYFANMVGRYGFDWVNISRHHIETDKNNKVFGCATPTLKEIKSAFRHHRTKVRIQAVVNEETSLSDYLHLIDQKVCDDLSFRSIMLDGRESARYYHEMYLKLIDSALAMGSKVIQQEIQDYYVYEVHDIGGRSVTFSYSNMEAALSEDKEDTSGLIREFILRPDGALSGSWEPGARIITKL